MKSLNAQYQNQPLAAAEEFRRSLLLPGDDEDDDDDDDGDDKDDEAALDSHKDGRKRTSRCSRMIKMSLFVLLSVVLI